MHRFVYKVIPAPRASNRIKGVRGRDARFAMTLEELMNENAAEGWEYLRSETLACERGGWFRRGVEDQTLLFFRRGRGEVVEDTPTMPATVSAPQEPRLAADRSAPRRASFTSLRAAPGHDRDRT